jgi:hypothetical protein
MFSRHFHMYHWTLTSNHIDAGILVNIFFSKVTMSVGSATKTQCHQSRLTEFALYRKT